MANNKTKSNSKGTANPNNNRRQVQKIVNAEARRIYGAINECIGNDDAPFPIKIYALELVKADLLDMILKAKGAN